MNETTIATLKRVGLNTNDIAVYAYLLKEGVSTPPQIAKSTGISRTNTYYILRNLDDLDLIDRRRRGNRFEYVARKPSALLDLIQRKREALEDILPELTDLYKVQKNKPV